MKALSEKYPDDLDAATLYAESGMNLRPWKLWNPDGTPAEGTAEIVATLESVLKRDPMHPGANHYYIHAVEASPQPERAIPSAERLKTLVPMAGHLVHMPAHIQMRTGDYVGAEKANAVAADVDRAYIRDTGANGLYPIMYYNHNVHFQSAAAAMAGRHAEAKKAADLLYADVLPVVSLDPMLELFLVQPVVVAVRFRKWDDLRAMPDPGPQLPATRALSGSTDRRVAAAEAGDAAGARQAPARNSQRRARGDFRGAATSARSTACGGCSRSPRPISTRGSPWRARIARRRSRLDEGRRGGRRARLRRAFRRGRSRCGSRSAPRSSPTGRRPRPRRSFAPTSTGIRATRGRCSASRRV